MSIDFVKTEEYLVVCSKIRFKPPPPEKRKGTAV